jgi:uridylate kinase
MEVGADVLIKATKVDAVYDEDPEKNPDAQKFNKLSYIDALNMRLRVMDSTAISLCMENNLPIVVLNLWQEDSVRNLVLGQSIGTKIYNT